MMALLLISVCAAYLHGAAAIVGAPRLSLPARMSDDLVLANILREDDITTPDPEEDMEEESDFSSFIGASADLHKAVPMRTVGRVSASTTRRATATKEVPTGTEWEQNFAQGLQKSQQAIDVTDESRISWVSDAEGSKAAIPKDMLLAETLLSSATEAPSAKRKEKTAELALRLYYHAKWLAERNYARAAEQRYRRAAKLARESRRSVLAAHALLRLGYFLMHWQRSDEAQDILKESESICVKGNPLAPFLLGILGRNNARGDLTRLLAAEDRILTAVSQPSEDLEVERVGLLKEITYWRAAETSPGRCFDTANAAHIVICLSTHALQSVPHLMGNKA